MYILFAAWTIAAASSLRRIGFFAPRTIPGNMRQRNDVLPVGILISMGVAAIVFGFATVRVLGPNLVIAQNLRQIVLLAIFNACGFAAAVAVAIISGKESLRRIGLSGRQIITGTLFGILGLVVIWPFVTGAGVLVKGLLHVLQRPDPMHPLLQSLIETPDVGLVVLLVVSAVITAPLLEEMLFRGLLQTLLVRAARSVVDLDNPFAGRWPAIFVTSFLFALVHAEPAFVLPLFILAVGLGWLYERTGNLWAPITAHALFNLSQICFVLLGGR